MIIDKIDEHRGRLLQLIDPIFNEPKLPENPLNYRTHFMAPKKPFAGQLFDTYIFNIAVIWLFTFLLYLTLYFNFFKGLINIFGFIKIGSVFM